MRRFRSARRRKTSTVGIEKAIIKVGVINPGSGNVGSVVGALSKIGAEVALVNSPVGLAEVERIVLPGVGSFARAMESLQRTGLSQAIQEFHAAGRPILGICLGMHLMSATGLEGGVFSGLGLAAGQATPLVRPHPMRVPHVGWNSVELIRPHPVLKGIRSGTDFYFAHSFEVSGFLHAEALASTEYGGEILAAVHRGSALGVQFHPEKSQKSGLLLLENFIGWDGSC